MSRRKQARPRHVDDPDLESPAIAANSVVPVFPEEGSADVTEKLDNTVENGEELHMNRESPTGDVTEEKNHLIANTDTHLHICSKCQAEFLDITELLTHKKDCMKPVMLLFKDNQDKTENQPDLVNVNGFTTQASDNMDAVNGDNVAPGPDSDQQENFDNFQTSHDEVDAGVEEGDYENQSNFDDMDDDYNKSLDDIEDEENDFDDLKENELGEKTKTGINAAQLSAYMQQLQNLIPGMNANSSSNVMLEPMEATKAAVAQFAENNPEEEKDVGKLQAALFNLQQQQMMQLQLIHQLQQQLMAGGVQNGQQLQNALMNSQLSLGAGFPGLSNLQAFSGLPKQDASSKTSSRRESPSPKSDGPSSSEKIKEGLSRPTSPSKSERHSPESSPVTPSAVSTAGSTTEPPSASFTSPSSLLMSASSKVGQDSTATSSSSSAGVLDYSGAGSKESSDGRSYLGGDDPFFKHKCRMCGKVFGSDSALQIHFRSHTDEPIHDAFFVDGVPLGMGAVLSTSDFWTWEKPFQCNICGGRFSTRGNLKVHFQRHKAEFPNVEMNPNPVPEHMDKNPMPLLGSAFPAGALTPFANPAFMMPGLMNGFMFPPPHLAPRPPMAAHSMIPKSTYDDRRPSSPKRESRLSDIKKEVSPDRQRSENPPRRSPDVRETAKSSISHSTSSGHLNKPSPVMSMSSIPLVSTYPVMSPLPSQPPLPHHRPPIMTSSAMSSNDPFRNTILPSNILDNDDNLEQFMEIDKSETSKLQQLVDNIEHKLTDPNQCVICHRVLSCKSALQMHYRIHTGERPFRCKICGRSFTTKGNLKTHMGVHRAKPPLRMMHQCPVCHKQFTNLLVLQQHIRSHTGMSGLPTLPGLSHLGMYATARPSLDDRMGHVPMNMKRHFPEEYEKELDLSKKPRIDREDEKLSSSHRSVTDDAEECNEDISDNEEQNEMDDEANKMAADEAKKEGLIHESSDGRSTPGNSRDGVEKNEDVQRTSQQSDALSFTSLPRSSSPKYLQEDSNPSTEGNFNAYSTSLAALEERVRQIDTTMARNPLSQFHAAPFLLAPTFSNGDGGVSPRSESGSDEGRKASTPGSVGDGSLGGNYLLGAMDGRPVDGSSKSTTCNVCYKVFACKSALDIHYRSHTHERPFKCDLCDKSFTTRGNMKQHLLTHKLNDGSENDDYESNNNNSCTPNQNDNDSDESDDSVESPREVIKKEHSESQVPVVTKKDISSPPEKASTSVTTQSSASSTSRSSSVYSSSDNQSPFISKNPTVKHQCLVCQKGFSSASALQIHIRTHTGDKPFKCNVCGKAFTTKGNLKVHMGTHMWNNSPSRRGRRMSIEPPFMLAHKENPYLPHGFPPRPEFYPFQFPPFMNGMPTPPKSLSDVSLLPGMSRLKQDLSSPPNDERRKSESSPSHDEKPKYAESGELDLSMKSTGSSGSRSSEKTSPSSVDSNGSSGMVSPPHMSLGWGWKASCHLCSRSFPTPAALEHHVRSMHMVGASLPKVEAS